MTNLSKWLSAAVIILAPLTASAAPPPVCNGMSEMLCGQASTCSWVGTYTRKDGRVVNGYCRTTNKKSHMKAGMGALSQGVSLLDKASRSGK